MVGCREDSDSSLDLPYDFRTSFDNTSNLWQVVLASKKTSDGENDGEMMVRISVT